jgi:hypothetical protein
MENTTEKTIATPVTTTPADEEQKEAAVQLKIDEGKQLTTEESKKLIHRLSILLIEQALRK